MLATGHFPGHGDTETNSTSRCRWSPRRGAGSIPSSSGHSAKRFVPASARWATFHGFSLRWIPAGARDASPLVMSDLLRRDMRFDGLLITDAMDMAGVIDRFAGRGSEARHRRGQRHPAHARRRAWRHRCRRGWLREGRYTEDRLNASVRRSLLLKDQLGLRRERKVSIERSARWWVILPTLRWRRPSPIARWCSEGTTARSCHSRAHRRRGFVR